MDGSTFDERLEAVGRWTKSVILIWSLQHPLAPQEVFLAPAVRKEALSTDQIINILRLVFYEVVAALCPLYYFYFKPLFGNAYWIVVVGSVCSCPKFIGQIW